ncbi:2Fe-2S iron-sulfur cluster-binding protein [Acinetobacter baumannii]|uniref:2Fe-2S iron-sulfur cluster-binding protein n=1 Tax=Acinetobacter baumannii TaxID=470 RepID=UPI0005A98C95|nr:2Fe-2S iron-sulfur cluster-binding protein [Acinetobacter baumannii]EKV2265460.1 (2Fe-2S)-binding protein [Acinetobacter baumannii]MBC6800229.1 (2Fe-2S)-binding protein [Acinetobacter baumannii]MBO2809947.1 (2Fe-2S)-binding protein [Acinetobacter baumannii]MBO2870303.1 (2Fe-2S)-binding protein [Acinetobacter baumannii]MBO3000628.1 (2Fe-2S)-binding protein [Acinetobacter baumannii]
MIQLFINGQSVSVIEGTSVAAALAQAKSYSRLSVCGEKRTPFCGTGVCQECRVNINGLRVLACQTLCQQDMKVETQ